VVVIAAGLPADIAEVHQAAVVAAATLEEAPVVAHHPAEARDTVIAEVLHTIFRQTPSTVRRLRKEPPVLLGDFGRGSFSNETLYE
jgi:hypothetical protein